MSKLKARELRQNMTDAEKLLWKHLRLRQIEGFKFRRQQPIGKYIVDFVCFEKKLIIELDGGQHTEQVDYDTERSHWLESQGFQIFRFWNDEVFKETAAILEVIFQSVTPHLDPPPQGGRRLEGSSSKRKEPHS